MKLVLLLLISFQVSATILEVNFKKDTIPDTTIIDYQLDIAGKAKFRDSVRFESFTRFYSLARFTSAYMQALYLPFVDGVLRISEESVYSGKVHKSDIEIEDKRIFFGDSSNTAKTSDMFFYDDSTGTLFVPNIVIGEGSTEELFIGNKLRKINSDYILEDRVETIFVDATQQEIKIQLKPPKKEGKSIFIKRTRGKHKFYVDNTKVKDNIKLIWDGEKWQKL